jgi:hypothetical protein
MRVKEGGWPSLAALTAECPEVCRKASSLPLALGLLAASEVGVKLPLLQTLRMF